MERAVTGLYQRAGQTPPLPPADLARLLVAVGAGARLEQAAEPDSSQAALLVKQLGQLITGRPAPSVSASGGRESQ
jgi:hypothetical protein